MEVCRACLCACAPDGAQPLFPAAETSPSKPSVSPPTPPSIPGLAEVLAEVTRLEVLNGDDLPNSICTECHDQLCHSQKFIKKARESYYILCSSLGKVMNGDSISEIKNSAEKKSNNSKDIVETNCEDICDEMGITIENALQIDESVNNFHGDISIIYCDKAVQVNLKQTDDHFDNSKSIRINGIVDNDLSPSKEHLQDDGNLSDKITEQNIKQEPEEYDETESYNIIPEDYILTAGQIKIEPLSEGDALKFHHGTVSSNPSGSNNVDIVENEIDSADCESFEVEYLEEDIKPTCEELTAYKQKYNNVESDDTLESDTDSLCSFCGQGISSKEDLIQHRKLHKSSDRRCALCNKTFKTRKRLKYHVISEHSYYEFMKCSNCDKNFMNSLDLNTHKCMPAKPKEYCSLCNTGFDSKEQLKNHLSTHKEIVLLKTENSESLLCSKCNEVFQNYSELLSHIEKKCVPPIQNDMEKKEESENNMNSFKVSQYHSCHHCNETFLNTRQLSSHIRIVHSHMSLNLLGRSFACNLCLYKFKRKGDLKRHLFNVHKVSSDERKHRYMSTS